MKWLRWEEGRQQTGYQKMCLLQAYWLPIPFDLYLLRYKPGSGIPTHEDTVAGYRHYRCTFEVWRAHEGGKLSCTRELFRRGRLTIFRSDYPHSVSTVELGSRYVLSFGFCTKKKGVPS